MDNCFCEAVHSKACKSILQVKKLSSNIASRAELGRTPLYPYVIGSVLRYWYKLHFQTKSPILKQAYISELNFKSLGKSSWLSPIMDIQDISTWNFGKNRVSSLIKKVISNVQMQYKINILTYLKELQKEGTNDKLRTYCHIKSDYSIEPYLLKQIRQSCRSKITSLRIGSHSLDSEVGRYQNPPIPPESRFCRFCLPDKFIGDECHFLTKCSLFDEKRIELFNSLKLGNIFYNQNDRNKFIILMTSMLKKDDSCLKIARYIYECFKLHSSHRNGTSSG